MNITENFTGLIKRTSDGFIRDNIYMVGKAMLAKALKNIEAQYQEKILSNMTTEGADEVKRLMSELGEISTEEIEEAQRQIISMAQGYI